MNNSGSSREIDVQKKTKKIFTAEEQNIKRRTSEHVTTNCCHNISLFQQIIEKPFSEFIINKIALAKTLKSISIKQTD